MSEALLSQFELLAQVDTLRQQTRAWVGTSVAWTPLAQGQNLLRHVLERTDVLRVRVECPLVVATFGGTGTGKSSLVNALVGADVTLSGRQRPTTRKPVVICHSQTDITQLGLPLEACELVRSDSEMVRDFVLVDCPDPDTSEAETPGSNLSLLHALLPYCDVLLYVSTQQKYRSARVTDELRQAADGCRVLFVQTHAELDVDIRSDWERQLSETFAESEIFFVDSLRALREQQSGQRPGGEMGRLMDLLARELGTAARVRIRRANVVDLFSVAVARCEALVRGKEADLAGLEAALHEQRGAMARRMSDQLCRDLGESRGLWERRLVEAVVSDWGLSPFSAVLRGYHGLGAIITSLSLSRARSTAQMAVIGVAHTVRMWREAQERRSAEAGLQRASTLGLDDALLRETELIIEGHVRSAGLDRSALPPVTLNQLREQASRIESQFLGDAGARADELIGQLADRNTRWWVRTWYEVCLMSYLGFVLYRVGKNFFYDSFMLDRPFLTTDFYLPAGLFGIMWVGILLMLFVRRLRRGLQGEIQGLARQLVEVRLAGGLFPELERTCQDTREQIRDLGQLRELIEQCRSLVSVPRSV